MQQILGTILDFLREWPTILCAGLILIVVEIVKEKVRKWNG